MEAVTIAGAGASLIVTGHAKAAVEAALEELVARGAPFVAACAPGQQVGCDMRAGDAVEGTDGGGVFADVAQKAARQSVKISSTGGNLMVTGADEPSVKATLRELVAHGAKLISDPVALGSKWIGTCTDPAATCLPQAPRASSSSSRARVSCAQRHIPGPP
jgi:hypothetical protein